LRPVLAPGDGPIHAFRSWASQFYRPREGGAAVRERRSETALPVGSGKVDAPPPLASPEPAPPRIRRVERARDYFASLGERFVASAAAGVQMVVQWDLAGPEAGSHHAVIRDGRLEVHQDAPHERPTVTIAASADDFVQLVNGELNGMSAFSSGRLAVSGDMLLAMRLEEILPPRRPG